MPRYKALGWILLLGVITYGCAEEPRGVSEPEEVSTNRPIDLLDRPEWAHLKLSAAGRTLDASSSAPVSGAACVTVNFDAGAGNPVSYTEAGMTVTSLFPFGAHLHMEFGPFLLNHTGCCSTPYEFKRTDGSAFTVVSLDIVPDPFGGPFAGSADFVSSLGAVEPRPAVVGTLVFPAAGWSGITSFLWNEFTGFTASIDNLVICDPVIEVDIDIKPGSNPNSINCNEPNGVIPVAILTTASFDATTVNHETVLFEGAREWHRNRDGTARRHVEDVDGDGDLDLLFHFRRGDTALTCSSTTGKLTGNIFAGTPIVGQDAVRMVPSN